MEFTIRAEIIILIIVLFFVMSGHLFCSCAQTTPLEAMTSMATMVMKNGKHVKPVMEGLGKKGLFMGPQAATLTEGFTGANTNNGESSMYNEPPVSTTSWFTPNLTYTPGQPVSQGIQNILNRPKQPVPLPEGEMLMFKNTLFSGECCPNTYSNSMGCACMTVDQYNYLIDRGGNNVPYSEY